MEVATEQPTASGQAPDAGGGNAGRHDALTEAITAAVTAQRGKVTEGQEEPSVKTAGDTPRISEDAAVAQETKGQPDPSKAEAEPETKGEQPKAFEAPQHWPEADRTAFAAMPPEQQAIIRRLAKDLEGGYTRKSQEIGDKARYADTVRSLIDDDTRHKLAMSGMNEVGYFAHLHKLQSFAAKDPVGFTKWVMQSNGITPEHLGLPGSKSQDAATPSPNAELEALLSDPKVKQLEAELAQIKGHLTERQQAELHALQMHRAQAEQQLQGLTNAFRSHLDDTGRPAFPHFDAVRTQMGIMMDADPSLSQMPDGPEKLQKAYDMAVWARPDLRASFLEQETSKRVQAAEKAREAARAKSITAVKPSAGVPASSAKPKSLDDIIRDQMSQRGIG